MQDHLVLGAITFWESQVVELADVTEVIDREALLELIWQLLHVLLVGERKDDARDVMVLAGCQFFAHTTDADDLSKRGNLTSHC